MKLVVVSFFAALVVAPLAAQAAQAPVRSVVLPAADLTQR